MLPVTQIKCPADDRFAAHLARFQQHARAIATGRAEGETFNWFLATEYQWEMERACEWLAFSPTSRLSEADKTVMCGLLQSMPAVSRALERSLRDAARASRRNDSVDAEWPRWETIAALPEWSHFTVQTAIALTLLGQQAQNDASYFARR